jgi:hypothetical protein
MSELSGFITSNAVSTLEINAITSLFSPLNGLTSFRASLTDIYSAMAMPNTGQKNMQPKEREEKKMYVDIYALILVQKYTALSKTHCDCSSAPVC